MGGEPWEPKGGDPWEPKGSNGRDPMGGGPREPKAPNGMRVSVFLQLFMNLGSIRGPPRISLEAAGVSSDHFGCIL